MKQILFSLLVFIVVNQQIVFSQDSVNIEKWKPTGELSLILRNSFGKPKMENTVGESEFVLARGVTHSLRIGYQLNLPKNFGVTARAGFGFSSIVYWDDFYDSVVWPSKPKNYVDNVTYNLFTALELGVNYKHVLKNSLKLTTTFGGGFNFSNSYGWGATIGNGFGRETKMDWSYNNQRNPFLFYELGVLKTLKNKNNLSLSLAYEYSFDPIYSGTYQVSQNNLVTSEGKFYNSGTNIGLNLAYTFTGERIRENVSYNSTRNGTTLKTEKKKFRKEKRFVHSKSIFVGVGTGLFFTKNKIVDKDSPFKSGYYSWWSVNGFAEIGMKKDYFYEFGLGFEEYASGRTFKNIEDYKSWSNMYIASKFYGGFGKRFIHKPSNRKILNVHAGLGMILTYNTNKTSGGSSGGGYYTPQDTIVFSAIDDYKLLVAPTLYVMLEKDFQLTKNLLFSLRYRYDQGIFPMFKQDISYEVNGVKGKTQNLVYGTSQTYGFALKYKLLGKKYRE